MNEPKLVKTAYILKGSDMIVFDKSHVANTNESDFETVSVFIPFAWIKKTAKVIESE